VVNLILNAIPFFLLAVAIEFLVLRHAAHDHDHDHHEAGTPAPAAGAAPIGYELKDTRTSLTMGVGHAIIYSGWKLVMLAAYSGLYLLTPLRMDPGNWWVWVLLFFGDDLCYYAYHRGHHRIRLFWATHITHHSSQHYNLSTALRQDWAPVSSIFFWAPLALLGFEPWMILLAISWNLLYQFWIHTEKIRLMPRWFEFVFNTPSHHRVHHGSNEQYLDKNYAGILIIWDRLFGTFEPESERVRYGLTKNIETFNPVRVAYHEFFAIWRDVRAATSWRERIGYMFQPPGWTPPQRAAQSAAPAPPSGVEANGQRLELARELR
jgi:sterol desaturase/sphingolipid hydroxylase (fatty acid hydroxylase superfamily)